MTQSQRVELAQWSVWKVLSRFRVPWESLLGHFHAQRSDYCLSPFLGLHISFLGDLSFYSTSF